MFHCNGWCFPWAIVLQAGTQVCLRRVASDTIFAALAEHGVTHLCGAPIVMGMLVNAAEADRRHFAAAGQDDDRGLRAARRPCWRGWSPGDRGHPCLRADRGLWAGHRLRLAGRMGGARRRGPLAQTGPTGRALPGARGPGGHGPGHDDARAARRHDHRRDHDARPRRHEGLPQEPYRYGGRLRRRLVPHRRPRGDARGWLCRDQGPLQGYHHLRRREHQLDRDRGRPLPPPGRARGCGGCPARRALGREPLCLRDPARRCRARRRTS